MSFSRIQCLKRAKRLIEDGSFAALRYASLELRYCIEAFCYDRLKLYKNILPDSVTSTWQPRRLVEALAEFDPNVNQHFQVVMCQENSDGSIGTGHVIGNQSAIGNSMLRKHYNKLGNFLHVPLPSRSDSAYSNPELIDYLVGLVGELDIPINNIFQCSIAETVSSVCMCCDNLIVRNYESIKSTLVLDCPFCSARYTLEQTDNGHLWHLHQSEYICPECDTVNYFPEHRVAEGLKLVCCQCESVYKIVQHYSLTSVVSENV